MFSLREDKKISHFNDANSKICVGEKALDFGFSWTIEFVLIPVHLTFKRAIMVGISSEYMYRL